MKTVFIVNHSGQHSYEAAKEKGELVYLTRGFIDIANDLKSIVHSIESLIATSEPEDYLLLSGNGLLCVMAFDLWKRKHGKVTVLHTINSGRSYTEHEFN